MDIAARPQRSSFAYPGCTPLGTLTFSVRFCEIEVANDKLTIPLSDATVEIAIWSNIETGLGITAGSLATLRPLLRHWLGSRNGSDYLAPSLPLASRKYGAGSTRPFPLGSLDASVERRFRPDKLAVTVTTVQTQRDPHDTWKTPSSPNSSEEGLTADRSPGYYGGGEMGLSIHQTFEVTQTTSSGRGPGRRLSGSTYDNQL